MAPGPLGRPAPRGAASPWSADPRPTSWRPRQPGRSDVSVVSGSEWRQRRRRRRAATTQNPRARASCGTGSRCGSRVAAPVCNADRARPDGGWRTTLAPARWHDALLGCWIGKCQGHDGTPRYLLTPGAQCCSTGLDGGTRDPRRRLNGWSLAKETDGGHATALEDAVAGQPGGGIREVMTPLCRGERRPSPKRSTLRAGTRAQMKSPGGRALLPGEPS